MTKYVSPKLKADREAAYKLIDACKHFNVDVKKVARIIRIIKEPGDAR